MRKIDLDTYARKDHFLHFLTMQNPLITVTSQVDITEWEKRRKQGGYPFFLSFQYAMVRAANRIPAFRQRILEDGIVEYEYSHPSYTVALPDGTYRYCLVHGDQSFESYLEEGRRKQAKAMQQENLAEDEEEEVLGLLFVSCVPWLSYTSIGLPLPSPTFSIPSLILGKAVEETYLALEEGKVVEKKKVTLPVTVLANHALMDGLHLSQFYAYLVEELEGMFQEV